jgi:hypothetical protein
MAYLSPIEEQFVRLNDRTLHYVVAGPHDRPAALLVHGGRPFLNWTVWDQNISALAESLHVFALDMPGYGQSEQHEGITLEPYPEQYPFEHFATTLAEFITELRLGPAMLKRGNFTSLDDLRDQILAFIAYYKRTMAKPIKWTYTGLT